MSGESQTVKPYWNVAFSELATVWRFRDILS